MFGFIEDKLAQLLDIPYEPFVLNGGGIAAMISRTYFIRVMRALHNMWQSQDDIAELMPIDKESDVVGMRIAIHKYYYDDRVLDGLTTGAVKETVTYATIKNEGEGTQRFDAADFQNAIRRFYSEQPMPENEEHEERIIRPGIDAEPILRDEEVPEPRRRRTVEEEMIRRRDRDRARTRAAADGRVEMEAAETAVRAEEMRAAVGTAVHEAIRADLVGEERPKKMHKKETETSLELKFQYLGSHLGIGFTEKTGYDFKVAKLRNIDFLDLETLYELAKKVNRHLIIGDDRARIAELKKQYVSNKPEDQHFLIIATNPGNATSELISTADKTKSVAFGKEINDLFIVKGVNVNTEIQKIKDSGKSSDEKEEAINKLIAEERNSPYAKFDKIYKDTATNVVFALQDRNIIYLTFDASNNSRFAEIALNEIARRFDGTVPYSELVKIDADYQSVLEKGNCDEYIKFITESSSSVIRQLKKAYEEAKNAYEDYLTKAMESGKMCSKYMEQIESFNEGEQQRKLKEKAFDEYMAVKNIPKIKSVFIKDEQVHIYTDNLYARDDRSKKMHDIGTFHIRIGMHSNSYDTNSTVIIKNTKHQITAFNGGVMQAPHVFSEGHICHGTLATGMANAYKKRDLYQLVFQLVLFLQQANTDDAAGKYVNSWPEVSEDFIKMQETKNTVKGPEKVEFLSQPEDKQFDDVFAQAIPV
jgi:hypothetical protein